MENTKTKSLSDSILELTKSTSDFNESVADSASKSLASVTKSAPETGSGIIGFISSISLITWIMIILILAFLGFNIFSYLAQGTQNVSNILAPLLKKIFGTTIGTASQTIDVAAEGGKAVTTGTATGINTGLSALQDVTPNNMKSSISSQPLQDKEEIEESKSNLNKALNSSSQSNRTSGKDEDYEPNQASSSVHSEGKAGWCFIGEDRGYRTCSKVGENDKCMSGDIFPSQELCINPNLRT
jgi:hypothetical protein